MISAIASQLEDSITIAVTSLAKKLKAEGKDVVGFGAGEPDFHTPKNIQTAGIDAIQAGKTCYTPESGIVELKNAICDKLKRDNQLDYTPDNIVVSCGAKHSIINTLMALIDPGDEIVIPAPYWVSYVDQAKLVSGVAVIVKTDESTGFKITADMLQRHLTPKSKLLILNSPSNPTGMVYSKAELEAIAKVVEAHPRLFVISDEIYEKLIYTEQPHVSIAQLGSVIKDRTIVINGVSKSYAMTGWRIGYLAAPAPIAKAIGRIQGHTTSNPTTPSQWASVEALNGSQDDVAVMKAEFDRRRHYMVATLNTIPGFSCLEPEGAFYAFPNISALYGKRCASGVIANSADFCNFLLKEALVACVPGSGFGADAYIRLSYSTSMADIEKGLGRIKAWVEALQ
ncbi:MAG: pyridoxal phosphate-dependent aminotransferase [Candidatus Margulisiibacteriota bacterium]